MPHRNLDAIFFVPSVPDIFIEDGMFHCTYAIGKGTLLEVVFTPNSFLKAVRRANEVCAEFTSKQNVVQLRVGEQPAEREGGEANGIH